MIHRLQHAGQHKPGDANILIVFDAGYDVTRLAHLLADLPVELLGRLRSDRVFCSTPPPRGPRPRPPAKHGPEFALAEPRPNPSPTRSPSLTPAATAPPEHAPGTGYTPD